jgi:hypothetical protein
MTRGLLASLGGVVLLGSCAYRQAPIDTVDRLDRLRFAACRATVEREICGYDPDCPADVPQMYLAQPPQQRRSWLLDYGCPAAQIAQVER